MEYLMPPHAGFVSSILRQEQPRSQLLFELREGQNVNILF